MSDLNNAAGIEMPRYKCHKEVWALKIKKVNVPTADVAGTLEFEDERYVPREMPKEFFEKHQPAEGGYYVVYKDGYSSFSPAEAFEDGYTKV